MLVGVPLGVGMYEAVGEGTGNLKKAPVLLSTYLLVSIPMESFNKALLLSSMSP